MSSTKTRTGGGVRSAYFSKELFQFLYELKFNNERAWFNANKPRYEAVVKAPLQRFMADAVPRIVKVDPVFCIPSFFRIYRDTRFAKDKTPYKTHAAVQFRHKASADDVHAPGFYLHLEPGDCFLAGGIWTPEPAPLKAVRQAIAKRDPAWIGFKKKKLPLYVDDKLKRPPKGFDPEHPDIESIKLRSFMSWVPFKDKETCAPDFMERMIKAAKELDPLLRFLNHALGLKG